MDNKFEFKYVELASMYDEQTKEINRLKDHIRMEDIEKDVLIATVLRHERTIDTLKKQNAEMLEALKVAFELIDSEYGNGIENGYWPTIAPIHERMKQAIALVEGT